MNYTSFCKSVMSISPEIELLDVLSEQWRWVEDINKKIENLIVTVALAFSSDVP